MRRPLPSGVVETPQNRCPRIALAVGSNFALGSSEFYSPIVGKFREKLEPLSLKIPSFSLSNFPSQTVWEKIGVKFWVISLATCQFSIGSWDYTLSLIHLLWDFHPMASCHVSTHGPHLRSCLTNSAHDTWHSVSHSKCVKCPPLPPLP